MGEYRLKTWEVVPILKPEVMGDGQGPWIPSPEDIWVVHAEEMREHHVISEGVSTITVQFLINGKPVVIIPTEYIWRAYEQGSLELLAVIREAYDAHAHS